MSYNVIPIVMAGGSGTRLWPLSRGLYPKQFLALQGEFSMLQNTLLRLKELDCGTPLVISNEAHRFVVAEQLRQLNKLAGNIILEPVGRNTAPAIALAALRALSQSDVTDDPAFCQSVRTALPLAQQGKLVTFGIVPTAPETGYGYIRRGASIAESAGYQVAQFVEKPDLTTATHYLESGEFYWNSGMFLFSAKRYLAELEKFRPDILTACQAAMHVSSHDLDFVRVDPQIFATCPDDSIDYAVMEKTTDAVMVPMDAGWSDVGSWSSLWDISDKTPEGNVTHGDVIQVNSRNNYVFAESALVTTVGVDDLVIVQTKDALLVSKRDQVQQVKQVVEPGQDHEKDLYGNYLSHVS